MFIVLEGPDGVGKTTVANKLHDLLAHGDVRRLHKGVPTDHPLIEYERDIEWYVPGAGVHVICDRWHVGEAVYGPIIRGSGMTEEEWLHIELFLAARGALLVYVDASDATLTDRYDEDQYPNLEQLLTIAGRYRKFFHRITPCARMKLFVDRDVGTEYIEHIIECAVSLEVAAIPLRQYPSYVGPPDAKLLLLGDKKGPMQDEREHQACFVPYAGTSGRYLLSACPWLRLGYAGVANANEENVDALRDDLANPVLVTLGREADQSLKEKYIPHGSVPHPQYVRRFHHKRLHEYGYTILQAAAYQEDMLWPS